MLIDSMKINEKNIRKEFIWHKFYKRLNFNNKIFYFIRSIFHGIITPFYFSLFHNHFQACLKNKSISKKGNFLPWFTYPLNELLKSINFENKEILEFGSGCSTHFFLDRKAIVTTYEESKSWLEFLSNRKSEKLKIYNRTINQEDELSELIGKKFDLIIIDGHHRQSILQKIIKMDLLNKNSAIIFDNSEVYDFSETIKQDEFNFLQKVDFYGHTPAVFRKQCSTILFYRNESCFLFDRNISLLTSVDLNSVI